MWDMIGSLLGINQLGVELYVCVLWQLASELASNVSRVIWPHPASSSPIGFVIAELKESESGFWCIGILGV
jgi:hypothetical protein